MSKVKDFPMITVRVQPNRGRSHVLWSVETMDGTRANGVAYSPVDAMKDAAAFVEAMSMPRLGGHFRKRELRVVDGGK
ncbi:hypothetical protein [Acetobacter sp. DmW_136]|uniref:hypothetical protein n=1 Tax=Acetobacter sp. DmW_136 TaxID=2591091 RepID=UPI001408C42B|nr:hypothetical protein [Acetobacter sp. DmW_136]